MDSDGPTASMVLFLLLLLIDAFFYGFGAAITNLNHKEIEQRAIEQKDKKSIRLQKIKNSPAMYVNTVQLVVTLINLIMGAFYLELGQSKMKALFSYITQNGFGADKISVEVIMLLATIATFFILIYGLLTFGVLLPKKIAAQKAEKWAYACINIVYAVTKLLLPLTGLVTVTTNGICFLLGMREKEAEGDVTEEEIINMVYEGNEQGVIMDSEAELISNIFAYGDKEAKDIMTRRMNIVAIEQSTSLQDAIKFMLEKRNSRFPVYEENIDHIVGILHLKDALRFHAREKKADCPIGELSGLIREAVFILPSKNIDELFKEMQSAKLQMVIVVDEYGQTDGLVAMEDILEEIVGNILDEYDEELEYIRHKGNNEYIMDGKTPIEELEEL
ncbi:MAG: HlyC/CorC family transporter, partial [Lachnospiraceae bacterium]|nr:HlyC/CorC family transporter [Lachnospiraceae bacterium]